MYLQQEVFKVKKFNELFPGILILIILLGIVCVIFYYVGLIITAGVNGVITLAQQISTLDTVLIIALISGSITILGLIINSIISIRLKTVEHKNKAKANMRMKMEVPYACFVNMIYDMVSNVNDTKKMNESEMTVRMIDFSKEVTLYGSNKVIKKWAKYRTSSNKLPIAENLKQLEDILYAIRADLGLKKRSMKTGEILALFINDVDEIVRKNKRGQCYD